MSLNPGGISYGWNYTHPENDNYSDQLIGTVVSMQEVQAREYSMSGKPGRPRFWDDGNPVMNIRMGFATPTGEFKTITFPKAGKKQISGEKPSLHVQLWDLVNRGHLTSLMGKTLQLTTWPANPTTGQAWGQGNPRLFDVQEVPGVAYQLTYPVPSEYTVPELLADNGASGGQPVAAAPAAMQTPSVPVNVPMTAQVPVQQMQQVQPMMQQQPMVQQQPIMQQQPMMQQQVMQQPATTAAAPAGMDPAVAAAMQTMGATNIQPVADPYSDIPF